MQSMPVGRVATAAMHDIEKAATGDKSSWRIARQWRYRIEQMNMRSKSGVSDKPNNNPTSQIEPHVHELYDTAVCFNFTSSLRSYMRKP